MWSFIVHVDAHSTDFLRSAPSAYSISTIIRKPNLAHVTRPHGKPKMAEVEVKEIAPEEQVSAPTDESSTEKSKGKLLEETQQRNMDVLAGAQSLLTVVVLALCCVISFSSRLFAVIRFESIIHEFDPW